MVKRICSIILSVLFVATMFVPAYAEEAPAECKHENLKVINIVEATCTEPGEIVKQCESCGKQFTEVTAKLSENGVHEYEIKSVDFDCIESDGYTEEVCKFCGAVKEGSRVEHKRDEDASKRAHKLVAVSAVAPTCKAPGYTAGTKCSVCGKILEGCKEIAKLSHDDMKNYSKTSTTATCIKAGVATYTCMYCHEQTKVIPEDALGHVKKVINYVKPTCVSVGNTGNTYCKRCGEDLKLEGDNKEIAIDPNNHAEYHEVILNDATCQASGLKNVWCTAVNGDKKCGYKADNVVIPQHTQKVVAAKAATCEKAGNKEYLLCSCGQKYSNDEWRNKLSDSDVVIPALGHNMVVDKAQSKEVTCLEDGYEVKVCANGCGKTSEKTVIKAVGHKVKQVLRVEPTCSKDGNKWHLKCEKCGVIANSFNNAVLDTFRWGTEFRDVYGVNFPDGSYNNNILTVTEDLALRGKDKDGVYKNVVMGTLGGIFEVGQKVMMKDQYLYAACYKLSSFAKDSNKWKGTAASQVVAKLNHVKNNVSQLEDVAGTAVAATCVANGKKADRKCKLCDAIVPGEVILATGHEVITTKEAKAAKCTEAGWTAETKCKKCGMITNVSTTIPALGHDYEDAKVVASAKPKCFAEANGYTVYKCNRCDVTKTVVIPWEHDYQVVSEKAPTCTEKGYKKWACSNPECTKQVTTYIDPLGHKADGKDATVVLKAKAATCTETGLTEGKYCPICDKVLVKQDVIPVNPANHKIVDIKKDATCTETGLTGGKECELCHSKDVYVAPTETPALGHDYKEDILKYKVATCTTPGYKVYVCSRCKDEYKVADVPVQGHVEVVDAAKAATCTEAGLTAGKHCSRCNEVLVAQEVVPALGHKEVADAAKAATCTETGLTEGKHCSVCDEILVAQEVIPALGHTEVVDAAKAATCTETGLTEGKHCSVCNEVLVAQEVVPALGHTEVVDEGKAATCTEAGLTEGKHCSVCNEVLVAQEVVPALGHTEVVDPAKAATCTETGLTEGKHCSVCNEVLVAQEVVSALGHKVVTKNAKKATYFAAGYTGDKVCSVCGKVITKGKAIAKLKLAKPSIKVTAGSKKLTVKISKKVTGATGYQVSYTVKGGKAKTVTVKSLKKVISKLSTGKTYTVKVRALVKSGSKTVYGSWSSAKSVKVK